MNNGMIFKDNELTNLLSGKIALNEVYIGKTKDLLAAEQQLDVFRNKYMNKYVLNTRVNSDPDLLKFDRMMEKIFGFGCFTLHIHNQAVCNAFTIPIDYKIDGNNLYNGIIADNRGFKFKPEYDYSCIVGIYSGAIFNPGFTTSEIMALILHEIGHNFNSALHNSNAVLTTLFISLVVIIEIIMKNKKQVMSMSFGNIYRRYVYKMGRSMREKNALPVVAYDLFVQMINIILQCKNVISDAIKILTMGAFTLLFCILIGGCTFLSLLNPYTTIIKAVDFKSKYRNEETADNFATIYGYGPELSTALSKTNTKESTNPSILMSEFNKIPIISTIMHLIETPGYILLLLIDEHPNNVSRVKDQINLLKRELDKEDIDPKMAKYIKSDLKLCEEALDMLVDCSEGLNDPYLGMKLYNSMCYYGNNTKKNIVGNKHKFEDYDNAFKGSYIDNGGKY